MSQMGVFFDLDGTLVYTTSSREERFLKISKKAGLSFTLQEVNVAYRYANQWWEKQGFKLSDWTEDNFKQLNFLLLKNLRVDSNLNYLAEKLTRLWEEVPWSKPYPEINDILKNLESKGFKLGILSHRSPPGIQRAIKCLGWQDHFTVTSSPVDAKIPEGKEDLRMWEYGLEKIGLKASKVIHVGDEYETDVLGAEKAGILPILIDRDNRYSNRNLHCFRGDNLRFLFKVLNL